ncbi:class F sortase [Nakamurella flavida]|uniref:Class F sortase n=1 Tax=Nakamurella flavida TaxID=363630 RepID=A0A939C0D6_9ACTN|nr:class F sortase [Nakamurella flavida]MBM9476608.1 class F sortase [Nakamurella flavida]MDP9778954.1 hypothetical protein [Nakamurella flavida]
MTGLDRQPTTGPDRRRARRWLAAAGTAGVLLLGACGSPQTTAPQPGADVAGTLAPRSSTVAAAPSSSAPASPTPAVDPPSSVSSAEPAPDTTPPADTPAADPAPVGDTAAPVPPTAPAPEAVAPLPESPPVSLSVPAIGVTSALLDLGLNDDGTVEVPPLDEPESKAGWYRNSPDPGSLGPSIILGHVDSKKYGPGVFYELGALKPGDTIEVTRQDNTVAVFTIDAVRSYPKSDFPTLDVYGNLDHAGIRLITCGGEFDPAASSYESNIIAFGTLTSSRPA